MGLLINLRKLVIDGARVWFFFFSSRRRHTRLQGDWSSDVCSSDLDRDDDVAAVESRPQQRRHDGREDDDQPAHRRRAALPLVTGGPLGADDLTDAMLDRKSVV